MISVSENQSVTQHQRLPSWFKQELPNIPKIRQMQDLFRASRLHTVCESAHCPNMGKCWGQGVATFMILGNVCTRACRFCAVTAGVPLNVDPQEPGNVAWAVQQLNLRYVVVTSVARDDLPDEGAEHFARTIDAIKKLSPSVNVEVLIPDLSAKRENLQKIVEARPVVISHNMETVRRLSPKIRPQADYPRSLTVLKILKELSPRIFTKSSVMVGLGETKQEILDTMHDLLTVGCDLLTIGQYLSPSSLKRHVTVEQFYTPGEFESFRKIGMDLGFKHVMSGPLVRSSYIAEEGYKEALFKNK